MALYKRRIHFSNLSIKVGLVFSRVGLTPNQYTLLTLILAVITFFFLTQEMFIAAAVFMILAAFFDFVDGSVARVRSMASRKGADIDTVMDRYVEGIIVFGLLFTGLPAFVLPACAWIFLYLFGSLMTTYAKSAAKEKEIVYEELKGGMLERAERMIILFIGILLASVEPVYLTYVIIILAVVSNISALQRIWTALRY
jgi:phosphatidylglycerophosphate synthase